MFLFLSNWYGDVVLRWCIVMHSTAHPTRGLSLLVEQAAELRKIATASGGIMLQAAWLPTLTHWPWDSRNWNFSHALTPHVHFLTQWKTNLWLITLRWRSIISYTDRRTVCPCTSVVSCPYGILGQIQVGRRIGGMVDPQSFDRPFGLVCVPDIWVRMRSCCVLRP